VEQCAEQGHTYTIRLSIDTVCVEEKCGTAYAYGGEGVPDYAICFIGIAELPKTKNWGWTNGPLSSGNTYTFPMYAGAGGCDISGAELAGTVTIDYYGSTATVTYILNPGFTMDVTHLYVGTEPLPRDKRGRYTVSPGQYPYTHALENATTDEYIVNGFAEEAIYVVAHAVACWFP